MTRPLVVAAKLVVPALRSNTIVRERIVARLDEATRRPLTLVSAPAGYGKTTAVATWLGTVGDQRAWVSLDELDNDPLRLCAHLLAAIEGAVPDAIDGARRALIGGSDLVDTLVPLIAAVLAERVEDRLVLVLDDYHVVQQPGSHAFVAALVDALPPTGRMIVCSRGRPPLRVARRQAMGTVDRLDWRDLAFQEDEAERLLNDSLELGLD